MDRTVKSVHFSGLLLDHLGSRTQRAATSQVTDTKGNQVAPSQRQPAAAYAILDDRERPFYECRMAAWRGRL
jgi:hypothetical protein